LILVPHTPHTIRKSVRSCESCHDSTLTAGLGNSLKRSVVDGNLFVRELKTKNRLLPQFQLKQVITKKGPSLQTAVPPREARFLNTKEVTALAKKNEVYRVFRYLNLQRQRVSGLLVRNEYPYDLKHKANEKKYGDPAPVEDLFYDFNKNQFLASGTSLEDILIKRLQEAEVSPETGHHQETEELQKFEPLLEPDEEPTLTFPEPAVEQEPMDRVSESSENPHPPEKPMLYQEENTIIDFFQGILTKEPPPPSEDDLEQQPYTE